MKKRGISSLARRVIRMLLGGFATAVLVFCLVWGGTYSAQKLKERYSDSPLFKGSGAGMAAISELGAVKLGAKSLEILAKYAQALADATIKFETLPEIDAFAALKLASALPEGVGIEAMEFEGKNLVIYCNSDNPDAAGEFYANIEKAGIFKNTGITHQRAGTGRFKIICEPEAD